MAFEPTKDQRAVIEDRAAADLVVSASAGSGKTTTMINRVMRILKSGEAKLNEILVLTFTIAAAADMKVKLYNELTRSAKENPACFDALFTVKIADICTIDAFCKKVVSEYFYIAKVDPNFKILDSASQSMLKDRAARNVINKFFNKKDESFLSFLQSNFEKRDDGSIKELIAKVFSFLQTSDNRDKLAQLTNLSHSTDLAKNTSAEIVMNFAKQELQNFCVDLIEFCGGVMYQPIKEYCDRLVVQLQAIISIKDFEKFFNALNSFERESAVNVAKNTPEMEERKALTKFFDDAKLAKKTKDFFEQESAEEVKKLLSLSYNNSNFLLQLTLEFEKEYAKLKKEKNSLEFADVQALCLDVLQDPQALKEITAKYKYVFVDEFQDVNGMQNAIISALGSKAKAFAVGDIKQSIYGFRLTDPKIFAKRFKDADGIKKDKKAVNLNANFRSTKEILEFNNFVFSAAMRKENCDIPYADEREGGRFDVDHSSVVSSGDLCEIFIIQKEKDEKSSLPQIYSVKQADTNIEDAPYAKAEALVVGSIIDNLRKQGYKDGDIAILCRKAKHHYIKEVCKNLTDFGFDLNLSFDGDLTKTHEVSYLHSLLRLVSNFKNDVDLASVMLSPLFGFSAQELKIMRETLPDKSFFYECVLEQGGDKVKSFINTVNEIWQFSKNHSVFEIAEKITIMFNYYTLVNKLGGQESLIHNYLSVLKSLGMASLDDYIKLTDNAELKAKVAEVGMPSKINVSTIHGSKGLEYKAVILIGAGLSLEGQESRSSASVTNTVGIATNSVNIEEDDKQKTLATKASKIIKDKEALAEEIRILYVALTRAKNRLYVIGADDDKIYAKKPRARFSNILEIIFCALSQTQKDKLAFGGELRLGKFAAFKSMQLCNVVNTKEAERTFVLPRPDKTLVKNYHQSLQQNFGGGDLIASKTTVTKIVSELNSEQEFVNHKLSEEEKERRILEGNAYHKFFEEFNFETGKAGELLPEVDKADVDAFLKSGLPQMLKGKKVLKEQKFVLRLENGSLMQGVIDLIAIDEDGFTLIDYKVSGANEKELLRRYKEQILLYARATEQILQIKRKKLFIYAVKSAKLVEVFE